MQFFSAAAVITLNFRSAAAYTLSLIDEKLKFTESVASIQFVLTWHSPDTSLLIRHCLDTLFDRQKLILMERTESIQLF